jgi:hypothetical protein
MQLETTTLFYYDLTFRSFDKSSAGIIRNWATQVLPREKNSNASKCSLYTTAKSSTLVSKNVKPVKGILKPLSEPLELISPSDDEWLGSKLNEDTSRTKHLVCTLLIHCFNYQRQLQIPIKVEDVNMAEPQENKSAVSTYRRFVNSDLPIGCEKGNKWRRTFIPSYITYVASYSDPWIVDDSDAVISMECAWEATYREEIPHSIQVNDCPIFSIVSPLLSSSEFHFY